MIPLSSADIHITLRTAGSHKPYDMLTARYTLHIKNIVSKIKIPDKIRNGRLKRIFDFYETLFDDYYHVAKDAIQDGKDRPVRTGIIFTSLAAAYTAYKTNPDERCFSDQLIEYTDEMGLVDPTIRNKSSYNHVHHLYKVWNENRLRRLNLIFFSILWQDDYPAKSGHPFAQCQYLKPTFSSFFSTDRILDVGIYGRWRILDRRLTDYDVNEEEWSGITSAS